MRSGRRDYRNKAAAICGADMKHYNVDSGSDEFNSVRGHEFAAWSHGWAKKVKDWKVGQRWFLTTKDTFCGVCPACEQGDFLCCAEKVNLGLDNNNTGRWILQILRGSGNPEIHRHALWEDRKAWITSRGTGPMQPINLSPQQSKFYRRDVVVIGTGPLGLFSVQMARIMGPVNIVVVGTDEDVPVRFPVAKNSARRRLLAAAPRKMSSHAAGRFAAKTASVW